MLSIGIDTGGTCTDGVIYNTETREVVAKTKALTTKQDLSIGIGNALDQLPLDMLKQCERVSLSTTLATNACVEGKGGRAKLILVGSTQEVLHRINAAARYGLAYDDVLAIDNKSSFDGTFVDMPDWQKLLDENPTFFEDVEGLGIAEVNALRNGSAIERAGADFFGEKLGVPVVQAAILARDLNVMERGATALLNARLLPVIAQFMAAVSRALKQRGLTIPVMIVRSDGSGMSSSFARTRPVETILCGPAASVSGARGLAQTDEALIVDMGGTTTDISIVHGALPVMTNGIRIGGWRTQIKGVLIDTIGLGGDSRVMLTDNLHYKLSSRRVVPLCIAATRWPQIVTTLKELVESRRPSHMPLHEFLYLVREPEHPDRFSAEERGILEILRNGEPLSVSDSRVDAYLIAKMQLENEGYIMRIGMTPTDAMHIKGDYTQYDARASRLAACFLMSRKPITGAGAAELYPGDIEARYTPSLDDFATTIYELVERKLYHQIVRLSLEERYPSILAEGIDTQLDRLIDDAWERASTGVDDAAFKLSFSTKAKLVGIGAPTYIFLPAVARALSTECILPEHAEVANAVGALLADIVVRARVQISPVLAAGGAVDSFLLHGTTETREFKSHEEAVEAGKEEVKAIAEAEARRRGALGALHTTVTVESETIEADDMNMVLSTYCNALVRTVE